MIMNRNFNGVSFHWMLKIINKMIMGNLNKCWSTEKKGQFFKWKENNENEWHENWSYNLSFNFVLHFRQLFCCVNFKTITLFSFQYTLLWKLRLFLPYETSLQVIFSALLCRSSEEKRANRKATFISEQSHSPSEQSSSRATKWGGILSRKLELK